MVRKTNTTAKYLFYLFTNIHAAQSDMTSTKSTTKYKYFKPVKITSNATLNCFNATTLHFYAAYLLANISLQQVILM